MKKIVILGAGISGLSVAWFLKKKYKDSIDLSILEKSGRAGGPIRTVQEGEFLFEAGPRGFRPSGKGSANLELVQELGIENALVPSNPEAKIRYIWLEGQLRTFSPGFLLRQGLLGAICRDLVTSRGNLEDETVAEFVRRRFGEKIAAHVMDPLCKGIFGGDSQELSMRSCFPSIWELEKQKRSVLLGMFGKKREKFPHTPPLYSFNEGMETLPKMLAEKLDCPIHFSREIKSLSEVEADVIISTLPACALASLVNLPDPVSRYATLTTVNFGWHEPLLPKKGFGFLIPSIENSDILGMTWDSEIFPHHGGTKICVMLQGDKNASEKALNSLKRYLGITKDPDASHIHCWKEAIPQYTLNHALRIQTFRQQLPSNVYALGNSFEGVGINDCIFNAKQFVTEIQF